MSQTTNWIGAIASMPPEQQEKYLNMVDYVKMPKTDPKKVIMPSQPFPQTDIGNAERFVFQHKNNIRYCAVTRTWFIWDGQRWAEDTMDRIYHLARLTIRSIPQEADLYPNGDPRRAEVLKWAARSESRERVKAMVDLAQSDPVIAIKPESFDKDPWLLNCLNGTLDLKTGTLQAHNRSELISKLAPVKYDPTATCPRWENFLYEIFRYDLGLINYIQKVFGYCLTGSTREQDFYLLYGAGANGKSTFIKTMMALLGSDYAKQTSAGALLAKHNETAGEEIAVLQGARMVATVEMEEGKKLAEGLVKQLTGGDRIRARRLYSNSFEFTPTFKIFMAANHKPRITGTDSGIWRRIKLIPFMVSIPEDQQDQELGERLVQELPGILKWAVDGCMAWQNQGLTPPDEISAATASYRVESDAIGTFLDEHVSTTNPEARTQAAVLYEAYRKWCENAGEHVLSMRRFNDRVRERGYQTKRGTNNNKFWQGIGLIDDTFDGWEDISREVNTS